MSANATGTPTALGIPKFNTASDAPNGKGVNEMMDALDLLLAGHYMTSTGDILYASGANTPARLAIGTNTYVLTSNGTVPTWAPGAIVSAQAVDYKATTAPVNITTTSQAGATALVTGNGFTADGTSSYDIFFSCPNVQLANVATQSFLVDIWEASTDLAIVCNFSETVSAGTENNSTPLFGYLRTTPASGTRTYSARAWLANSATQATANAGTGTAGGYAPMTIRVVKVV